MAVQHGYGKIAGADALVFAYDTGDTVNSYKGEPAENLSATMASAIGGNTSLTYPQAVYISTALEANVTDPSAPGGQYSRFTGNTDDGNNQLYTRFNEAGIDVRNTTITYSVYLKGSGTCHLTIYADNTGYGTSPTITLTDQWTRYSYTRAVTNYTTNCWVAVRGLYTTTNVYVAAQQSELKSHATPFVNGTRSATQGLLDLTGNSTIDLGKVSFDSDAQMFFDGTDDEINTGITTQLTDFSCEIVFKNDNSAAWGRLVDKAYANGFFISSYFATYGVGYVGAGIIEPNPPHGQALPYDTSKYNHFVVTRSGTTHTIYLNGSANSLSKTGSSSALGTAEMAIGAWYDTYDGQRFTGEIPVVKLYNRALTAAEVQNNFNNYRKRFEGLDYYYDNTTDGGRWIRFWWYTGVGWPGHETEALGHPFGTFDPSSHYGFQRLPEGLNKDSVELLAKDGDGNIYKWDFADTSGTAQSVWDSFTQGTQGVWVNNGAFMPTVIAGGFHGGVQDTWQYRVSEGVASFLLDDDSCDCVSTLNAGHAMCGDSGWNQTYAQPDGAYLRYGVDTLNDGGCLGPVPTRQLELYYRIKQ